MPTSELFAIWSSAANAKCWPQRISARSRFNEIKEILNGMGLDFGMEFDEQGNPIPGTGGRDGADLSDFEGDEE